jgi:rhodanese-related sulfurtransferase
VSVRSSTTPTEPPVTVDQLLEAARSGLIRLSPAGVLAAMRRGAVLVDIRADGERDRDGVVPGARHVARNVLEWRCDPASPHRDPELARWDAHLVLMCDEGCQSSLAAATPGSLPPCRSRDGRRTAGAWRAAGLPVARPGAVG